MQLNSYIYTLTHSSHRIYQQREKTMKLNPYTHSLVSQDLPAARDHEAPRARDPGCHPPLLPLLLLLHRADGRGDRPAVRWVPLRVPVRACMCAYSTAHVLMHRLCSNTARAPPPTPRPRPVHCCLWWCACARTTAHDTRPHTHTQTCACTHTSFSGLARALLPRSVTMALALPISSSFEAPMAITAAAVLIQVRSRAGLISWG